MWEGEIPTRLKRTYGTGVETLITVGQKFAVVDHTVAHELLRTLRDEFSFNFLVDETAVHFPKKDLPMEMVWVLYSFATNERIRIKAEAYPRYSLGTSRRSGEIQESLELPPGFNPRTVGWARALRD